MTNRGEMENKQERETVFLGQGLAYPLCMWVCTQSVGGACAQVCVHVCDVRVRAYLLVFTEESIGGNVALILLPLHQLAS